MYTICISGDWRPGLRALSVDTVVQDRLIGTGDKINTQRELELKHRFGIDHPPIQLESSVARARSRFSSVVGKMKAG